ncbi:1-O-acylceramide synthase precursor, putative [Entamoeba invadens IP1]|uniref:1-O-acylceramide synthase, putative n=1 Tax=Entamoeba invadens TaxID=33085 RepID=S0B2A4_ENTIV|nr:1-O-acylceramide synthase precursor, putative [Entamoeba invadens IP1]ELP85207.1 1-O-acylceramide synthase precursor, putative [Entamoeba invadens IP1]BAN41613.1 1-O-acylceramide synthase precursor, putative [Entamoeba invadens]|eukprot:XP_004184553.1 1-O-acylceramide synthase precursor, putative [Entamoeba invadens IP1]
MVLYLLLAVAISAKCSTRKPVVLIHGILSSVLEAEVNIPDDLEMPEDCARQRDNFRVWQVAEDLNPKKNRCLLKYMTPVYNTETGVLEDLEGVNVTVPQFGSTYSSSCLDPGMLTCSLTEYFRPLIKKLNKLGYVDGVDLYGAPYDWRYTGGDFYAKRLENLLKSIKEKTGKKAVLVSHSMGCPVTFDALSKFNPEDYVERWVTVGGAWLGAVELLNEVLNGIDGVPVPKDMTIDLVRHIPAMFYMTPRGEQITGELVKVGNDVYTVDNIGDLYEKLPGMEVYGKKLYNEIKPTAPIIKKAPVKVYCTFSDGFETPRRLEGSDVYSSFNVTYDNGDGVVNIESLQFCNTPGFAEEVKYFGKYQHKGLLGEQVLVDYLQPMICE